MTKFISTKRKGFYVVYAVLFIFSIGLACTFYIQQSYHSSHTHSTLHAKVQLQLYARSIKQMAILCLENKDFQACQMQEFTFPQGYHFRAILSKAYSQAFFLDIHGSVTNPASNNISRITKRYILLTP